MADYTITGRDELGTVVDGDVVSSQWDAVDVAVRLRVDGLRVTVRPSLSKKASAQAVARICGSLTGD